MTQGSINTLLGTAISRFQKAENTKEAEPSPAVEFDKGIIKKAIESGKERSIRLSVASATALQRHIRVQTPGFVNKLMATQPFDVIRKQFLLSDGTSLDNERLLQESQGLPSKEAGQLLRLGVESAHLEVQLLAFDDKGQTDSTECGQVIKRLEAIEKQILQIAAILDPDTLLLKK